MLYVERISGPEALDSLEPEWNALVAGLSPYLPFRTALWNRLWWKHLRRRERFVYDEFFVLAVRDDHDRLVAVAPLMLTRNGISGLPRVRVLQFFGRDPFVTEIRGLICRPEDQCAVTTVVQQYLTTHQTRYDWCQWSGVNRDTFAVNGERVRWDGQLPNYYLVLPATWEAFKSALPRNITESLRKCYNSLKRAGHEFTLRVVSDPADVNAALERFFELHTMRAQVRHSNVFETKGARAFLVEFASQMAKRGDLRIFQLHIGGIVVATRLGFLQGSEIYLYYSGYDVEWAQFSVMTTVTAEAIKWAIEHQFTIVNLSAGRDVSKTRWRPMEVVFSNGIQISRTWRGQLAFHVHNELRRLNEPGSPVRRLLSGMRAQPRADFNPAAASAESDGP